MAYYIDMVKLGVWRPDQMVFIHWEVDSSSGCTACEACRGQYEIDTLEAAGYVITDVTLTY